MMPEVTYPNPPADWLELAHPRRIIGDQMMDLGDDPRSDNQRVSG